MAHTYCTYVLVMLVIRTLNIDGKIERFERLRASRYNPTSLSSYGNRFRAAVNKYLKYLEDPGTVWAKQPTVSRTKTAENTIGSNATQRRERVTAGPPSSSSKGEPSDLIQYPFPLRSGVMAYLSLPWDLRRDESQRIAAFVASLAIDPLPDPTGIRGEHP